MSSAQRNERYAAFRCPSCKVEFQLVAAENIWDEELQYDFVEWLKLCIDERAVTRASPGACPRLSSYFELLNATDEPANMISELYQDTARELE